MGRAWVIADSDSEQAELLSCRNCPDSSGLSDGRDDNNADDNNIKSM